MVTLKQRPYSKTHNRQFCGIILKSPLLQFYLEYGRMFQSALNLYLICHTLHHSSLVHGFFVNLQTDERDNYSPDTCGFQSERGLNAVEPSDNYQSVTDNMGCKGPQDTPGREPRSNSPTVQLSPHGKITHAASRSREERNLTVLIATSRPVFTDFAR